MKLDALRMIGDPGFAADPFGFTAALIVLALVAAIVALEG